MKAVNKFFIALFCFISAAVCGVVAVLVNSTLWEEGVIPLDLGKKLSWFGEHPDETTIIVYSIWVAAGILLILGVVSAWRIATDKRTTSDDDLGIPMKRLED